MNPILCAMALLAGELLADLAPAQAQPPPAPAQSSPSSGLACTGPFAGDTSHAKLVAHFGEANVAVMTVDGPESSETEATVIFRDDPARRIEISWKDAARTRPDVIRVEAPSGRSVYPFGVRIGRTLVHVTNWNGGPFHVNGFGWDNEGLAEFKSGRLARLPGGCALTLRFQAAQNPLGPRFERIMGNRQIASDDPLLREAKPTVVEIFLSYK